MESCVYFKFKSQKEPTRVEFDGTGISVFELKREIILKSGLGSGTDFDLAIYTEDGSEEYDDDTTIITRSTTVIARRLPPMKPGAGRAARYVNGKMPIHAKNQSRREHANKASAKSTSNALEQINKAMTEEEKLAAVFKAQSDAWNNNEDELAKNATTQQRGGHGKKPANVPDHEPPNGYICYRCGEKGHWIQLCPTNDNPEYDNRPRVKRTTGIPRSFLKTVDKSTALGHNGTDEDSKPPVGLMVNADGEFVVAAPDTASWQRFQAKAKNAASKQSGQDGDKLQGRGLICELDNKMFLDPMKTPCCAKTYCNECISNALMESDFVCPGCQKEGVLLDDLENDSETSAKIQRYLDDKSKQTQAQEEKGAAKSPQAKSPSLVSQDRKKSRSPTNKDRSKTSASPTITSVKFSTQGKDQQSNTQRKTSPKPGSESGQSRTSETSRKRPAEDSLDGNAPKIPKGPKAMQTQQPQNQPQNPGMTPVMNGMNGMNGMMPMMGMGMNSMNPYMMPMNMPMMNGGGFPTFPAMNGGNMYPNMNGNDMGGMGMGGGQPNMNGNFMGNGGGMNTGGGYYNGNNNHQYNNGGSYQGNRQWRQFNNHQNSEEDDAYMRKPVNPHRHQNRIRRARPSDYREL
ncbi:putative retinoblastoma-binding protein [Zalerion maritima]|uniref:Retinoblastoma-binding protein n=1 Tax=Zalerion maritima TaxID=339359 RepID=A0AAD5RQT3_9PEZI|nr:putative retinoblastoma-binding protein [Zalerion maritima]